MILLRCASVYLAPPKFSIQLSRPQSSVLSPNAVLCSANFRCKPSSKAYFECSCTQNEDAHEATFGQIIVSGIIGLDMFYCTCPQICIDAYSQNNEDIPWDSGNIWRMAFYMFSLHIPLSFGGLFVVAEILREPVLDPQTTALSLLAVQILELIGTLFLLHWTAKPKYKF